MTSEQNAPATVQCFKCGRQIDSTDNYCRYCGTGQGKIIPWYYKHYGIIILTFFVLGPVALFYVWRSPLLGKSAKIVYTVINLAYTYMIYLAIQRTMNQTFSALDSIQQGM